MTEIAQLMLCLKRQLKSQGYTYKDVAKTLDMAESGVKRLFSSQKISLDRLAQLAQMLGFSIAELMLLASTSLPQLRLLTRAQEAQLVADERLLLVAVCALNHWSVAEIAHVYRLSEADIFTRLMVLERMGLLQVLPGNRIRLLVRRDFDWLPDGPIRAYFLSEGLHDFLNAKFVAQAEVLDFSHAMLTATAATQFQAELRKLRSRLAQLHDESATAPLADKTGVGLLLALREWEPRAFAASRRT
jgi:transcriptional regulator with XRE-family HTH domain